ncbi:MAG: hypothetical protein JJV94_06890 [Sulfurospirillum sp.]|nr:hypothetical protein [Sulfurospirillum sp.]
MTMKAAILKSLEELKSLTPSDKIYDYIVSKNYCIFEKSKRPKSTVSAQLANLIKDGDSRVKRIKGDGNFYLYYHTKNEESIDIENSKKNDTSKSIVSKKENLKYHERDLHVLLSSYLNSKNIHSKTISHEHSKQKNDNHQKWIHPDMIGIDFLKLQTTTRQFVRTVSIKDIFKITSYEVKKEINTDYELKKCYFQAVSNSSWANYGYLVAFEISSSLIDEMERLNQSFGIGIIRLNINPFESKILFRSKYKELDFKTIDKLSKVNVDFKKFIAYVEKILTADEKYINLSQKELIEFCDKFFTEDSEIEEYCKKHNISSPTE